MGTEVKSGRKTIATAANIETMANVVRPIQLIEMLNIRGEIIVESKAITIELNH